MNTKIKAFYVLAVLAIAFLAIQISCKTPEAIANKTGAQLWGEHCNRCHNAPSPADYSDNQWDVISKHMKVKAGLTDAEVNKIVTFLKSAN